MAQKGTTIKDALVKLEEKQGCKASDCTEVPLFGQIPPIEKMDASLSTLTHCQKLSLSTNSIEKIANLNGLKNLKILSLGRNNIKSLAGLEAVSDTLEQLWISYNNIDKLKGINVLKKLQVLYMLHNKVADLNELGRLADMSQLHTLLFAGNPLETTLQGTEKGYRGTVESKLKQIKNLDGLPIIREEDDSQVE